MSLFAVAFKNIRRNFHTYFLYFVSMVFSIMIFYTFTSIQYNRQVIELTKDSLKMDTAFKVSAIIIAIFAAMFIWYSNSFFTRKRKKEVALFSMLGVKKRQIARMLFYENLVMGALALATGISIGSLFSRLFIMILVKLMGFHVSIRLDISAMAIVYTIAVFLIIFLIASVHAYSLIYRFKLIDLFKSEKAGQREPRASFLMAILSLILIGSGYYMAITYKYDSNVWKVFVILISTVIGTYAFFSSLMVFLVKLLKKNKSRHFKGMNMISTSSMLFRIRSHGKSLATIAVLSATTITAMGTAASIYYEEVSGINNDTPFSFAYESRDKRLDKKIDSILSGSKKNTLKNSANVEYLHLNARWPNLIKESFSKDKSIFDIDDVISESSANKALSMRGIKEKISLKPNQVFLFFKFYSEAYLLNPRGKTMYYKIEGKEVPLKIKDFSWNCLINRMSFNNSIVDKVVVEDSIYRKLYDRSKVATARIINISNPKEAKRLNFNIRIQLTLSRMYSAASLPFSSYYENYTETMIKMGIIIFLGFFIGSVFLICTGSVIFFKQLSEASDDKDRYDILRKVGVKNSEIKLSIAKQMGFVFGFPLMIGITHSLVAISMLKLLIETSIIVPVCATVGLYTTIYLIYYFATVNSYHKIVTSRA